MFAYETGHMFTAPDCENCAPNGGLSCLVKGNDFTMCVYTLVHLVWMSARMIAKHTRKAADIGTSQQAHGAASIQSSDNGGLTQWLRPGQVGDGYVLVAHDS